MSPHFPSKLAWVFAIMFAALSALFGAEREQFLDVVVQNRFFDAPREHPSIQVRLREPVDVKALVYDASGQLLSVVPSGARTRSQSFELSKLPPSSAGLYYVYLVALDGAGSLLASYPTQPGGGEKLTSAEGSFDRDKRLVSYFLPKPAYVRIRAGLRDGVYLQEIMPWQVQTAGSYSLPLKEETPVLRQMSGRTDFNMSVLPLALPNNLLVDWAQHRGMARNTPQVNPPVLPVGLAHLKRMPLPTVLQLVKATNNIVIANDYRVLLDVQKDQERPMLQVRVDCDGADRARLLNRRFELMLFLDGVFIIEDEEGLLPFSYQMSTRGIPPGEHVVSVNVLDADGVPGTVSQVIVIQPTSKKAP